MDPLERRPSGCRRIGISDGFRRESDSRKRASCCRGFRSDTAALARPAPQWSIRHLRLSSVSIVVPKQTTERFSALDFPLGPAYFRPGIDDSVPESLVVAFVVKVLAELSEGSTQ